MAMIDKIRKRKELLIIFIGLGMLGFLVPYDAVMALMGVGQNQPVGVVNGNSVSLSKYQEEIKIRQEILSYTNNQSLQDAVWNDLIEQNVLADDFDVLGLDVSEDELGETIYGDFVTPFCQSVFYGNGTTTKSQMRLTYEDWKAQNSIYYYGYRDLLTQRRKKDKWNKLVEKGAYANTLDGKYDYVLKNDKRTFDFVFVKYDDVADSLITWNDSDLKSYYNKHKGDDDFKQETDRDFEYIEFKVEPSEDDVAALKNDLEKVKTEWLVAVDDSAFCASNAETKQYNTVMYKDGDFSGAENEDILNNPIGSIVGPYTDGNYLRLVKIIKRGEFPDSVECRHILLKTGPGLDNAAIKLRADSILNVLQRGKTPFADLVEKFTEDTPSKENGGKYEWFGRGKMVAPFEKACFDGKIGDLTIAETRFGYHIIEILGQKDYSLSAELAPISRPILPSAKTIKSAFRDANDFAIMNSTPESFREAADTSGYAVKEAKNIKKNAPRVNDLNAPYELITWAYQAELGEISSPMLFNNKYVIAHLTAKRAEGAKPFEDVKEEIEALVVKDKKAEYLMKIMGDKANDTPEKIATAVNSRVKKAADCPMVRTNVPASGSTEKELRVIGLAFGIEIGRMSLPLKGESGVFVIAPSEEIVAAEEKTNYIEEQATIITTFQSRARSDASGFYGRMKEAAKVKDNRLEL
jgi:peptidyl-prolyl cis-trans isomerase D